MDLFSLPKYATSGFPRPDDLTDPKLKNEDPDYSKAYAKFIYSYFCSGYSAITSAEIDQMKINRSYAMGRQDPMKTKNMIIGGTPDKPKETYVDQDGKPYALLDGAESWVNIDWESIYSPMPKLVNTVVGMLSEDDYEIEVYCFDQKSVDLKTALKYKLYAQTKLQDFFKAQELIMGIESEDEQPMIPSDIQELEMFEQLGMFKLQHESGMEMLNGIITEESDTAEIERLVKEGLIIDGVAAVGSFFDPSTKKVINKYLDPTRLIMQKAERRDFSDAEFGGYIETLPLLKVIEEANITDKKKIRELANQYAGKYGNPGTRIAENRILSDQDVSEYTIPVLHCRWLTIDSHFYTKRINRQGEVIRYPATWRRTSKGKLVPPKERNKEDIQTTRSNVRVLYGCSWVIDTEVVYDIGKTSISPFDFDGRGPMLPFHVFKIGKKPIAETAIPVLDQIQLTYIRLQDSIAKAPPPGLAVELGSIEDITIGNQRIHPRDTISIRTLTGNFFYRFNGTLPGEQGKPVVPFTELKGGVGTAINDAILAMGFFNQQLSEIAGIDRISSISQSPSSKTGKGVTEMAMSATTNAISNLKYGLLRLKVRAAKCNTLLMQGLSQMVPIMENPYTEKIGYAMMASIYSASAVPPVKYGFYTILRPSNEMKAEVIGAAQGALAGGKNGTPALKMSEYLFITSIINKPGGIKYAQMYIAYKENMAEQMAQARAQQTQMAQAEMNQQQEQEKQKTLAIKMSLEHKNKMEEIEAERDKDIAVAKATEEEKRKTLMLMKSGEAEESGEPKEQAPMPNMASVN